MSEYWGGKDVELVAGSFKSFRVFRISDGVPTSAGRFSVDYPYPEIIYEAECGLGPNDPPMRLLEKAIREHLDELHPYSRGLILDVNLIRVSPQDYYWDSYDARFRLQPPQPQVPTSLSYAVTYEVSRYVPITATYRRQTHKTRFDFVWDKTNHNPPEKMCTCGYYSAYTSDVYELLSWATCGHGIPLVGVVENLGRVTHGTKGVRAQKVKVLGVAYFEGIPCERKPLYVPHGRPRLCLACEEKQDAVANGTLPQLNEEWQPMLYPSVEELLEAHPLTPFEVSE